MKRLSLVLWILISSSAVFPQSWGWSDAVPITDSMHFNRNVFIADDWNIYSDSVYAVWEVSDDTLSTAIWCRDIKSMGDPFPVLTIPGVHFRNPEIFQVSAGDTLFYLYYETDQAGNWDIMYVGYLGNGIFSAPVPFSATPGDDGSFVYGYQDVVWISDGDLYYGHYTIPGGFIPGSQVQVIDTGGCRNPVFNGNQIAWEKPDGADVGIWASYYGTSGYSDPELIVGQGDNQNLTIGTGIPGNELIWQSFVNGTWQLQGVSLPSKAPLEIPQLDGFNNIQPEYSHMYISDKCGYPFEPGMLTFSSDSSGNNEIYAFEEFWYPNYVNLSSYPHADVNPALFLVWNYEPGNGNLILTWESNRNGNWQIWMRNVDIYMAIPDPKGRLKEQEILMIPNPMNSSTTIMIPETIPGPCQTVIYSQSGQAVRTLSGQVPLSGSLEQVWDGRNDRGSVCPNGMYLVTIRTGSEIFHGTLIVSR